jgi:hypothetical protein
MTINAIRELHEASPFRPFDIVVADGTRIHVPHPEFLAHPGKGRMVVAFNEAGDFKVVDLLLVTHLEVASNGRSHRRRKAG